MQVWDCELREHSSAGATSSAYSCGPTRSLARIPCRQVEDWHRGEPVSKQMSTVNIERRRHPGLTILLGQHAEVWEIMYVYFRGRGMADGERYERTKSDATNSKPPSSRYSTATKAQRAVMNIQNLLRIVFRIDSGRAVFLAGCAQRGGEDVELSMQTSSTSQNDKTFRRSRPSQSQGWVQGP